MAAQQDVEKSGRDGSGCRSLTDCLGKVGCLGNHPLQDAGVFPASGDQVTVVVQEGNVGHVTAVTTVLVARSLEGKQKKRKNEFLTQGGKK